MKITMRDGTGSRSFKYVAEDMDRHGNVRVYLRRRGQKIRLRETPGTPEFDDEYREALSGNSKILEVRTPAPRETLRWLVERYYESPEFKKLAESTRAVRRRILDAICEKYGRLPFARLESKHVREKIRNPKQDYPAAANNHVRALSVVFSWAIEEDLADTNPCRDVSRLKLTNPDGWHTWTPEEVEQYAAHHPIGSKAYKALAIGLFSGVRRSDAVQLGKQMERPGDEDAPHGYLHFTEAKNRARKPKHREIPIIAELRAALDACPSGHLNYLVTEYSKPFTPAGFGNRFGKWCDEAGLSHCSFHGLRKAGATIAANNGATEHQLMAIFAWESPKQAAAYTKKANRKRLANAAMHLLVPEHRMDKAVPLSEGVTRSGTNRSKKA